MPFAKNLRCPICSKEYGLHEWQDDQCGYRLRIEYDLDARSDSVNRDRIRSQPPSHWKYWEFFPLQNRKSAITIGEGNTSLVRSTRLAKDFGIKKLFFKLESSNPSGSFKDRPISIGVSMAVENGKDTVTAASSGNAAASLASLGAKAGLSVIVFVPERAAKAKITQLLTLGATVVRVQDDESVKGDPSVYLFNKAIKRWEWVPSPSFGPFNPHQFEGTKSLGYEIIEQLDWEVPDWILCNTGSGGLLGGTAKGFQDWVNLDWIPSMPRMVAVQPLSCSPVVTAIDNKVKPFEFQDQEGFPETVAGGLADPHPWDGDSAIEFINQTNGGAVAVTDAAILKYQKLLASKEGIFGSPSGVAALAGLQIMIERGEIDTQDTVVIPITGHGLKDQGVLEGQAKKALLCRPDLDFLATLLTNH